MAGDPDNIKFVKDVAEHLKEHGGSFRKSTEGELLDRTAGGTIAPIVLRNNRTIGVTEKILGAALVAIEILEYSDPISAFTKILEPKEAL